MLRACGGASASSAAAAEQTRAQHRGAAGVELFERSPPMVALSPSGAERVEPVRALVMQSDVRRLADGRSDLRRSFLGDCSVCGRP